ncbi:MAG: hypothetical protein PVF85_04970 [Anaerolineales bacterium]|jgi:hypothetical protein
MNTLVQALGPIFVASFALQQLLQLLDPVLDKFMKEQKGWILSAVALIIGLLLTIMLDLRVLSVFGLSRAAWLDVFLTALFISGGTNWLNDLLKIVEYRKLEMRARAMIAERQSELD